MLTPDQQAQAAADRRYADEAGHLWRVCQGGNPCVVVPGASRGEAIARYYDLMGITGAAHPPAVEMILERPQSLSAELKELPEDGGE